MKLHVLGFADTETISQQTQRGAMVQWIRQWTHNSVSQLRKSEQHQPFNGPSFGTTGVNWHQNSQKD